MTPDGFTVAWVCALALELVASRIMLDEEYSAADVDFDQQDLHESNSYTFGRIGGHNVVIICLPAGGYGIPAAAAAARELLQNFPNIRFGLMVGIGGGFPTAANDIRLGDIVVSQPVGEYSGVVQYDFGKALPGRVFQKRGSLNKPPKLLLSAVEKLKATHDMKGSKLPQNLDRAFQNFPRLRYNFSKPIADDDRLHEHEGGQETVRRPRIDWEGNIDNCPRIHYGLIATGNSIVASSEERDKVQALFSVPILCFEMEAAGLMDEFPCIVIRGISDYAVSSKGDIWQRFAAANAAAYARELLEEVKPAAVKSTVRASELGGRKTSASLLELLSSRYQEDKNSILLRPMVEGTCKWFLNGDTFLNWRDRDESSILWVTAGPGCGKSVLSQALVDKGYLNPSGKSHICYFFFKDGLEARTDGKYALSAILHQLFSESNQKFISKALPAYERHGNNLKDLLADMWNILIECAKSTTEYIICVLDALDECERKARVAFQSLLHTFYASQATRTTSETVRLKFLITSRPYDDVKDHFSDIMNLGTCIELDGSLHADAIASDINLVIDYEVPRMLKGLSGTTCQSVVNRLKGAENRNYLWLYLTLDIIRQNPTGFIYTNDFGKVLDTLPTTVEEAYGKILQRVGHIPRARKILQIILAAHKTLTLEELNVALAISEQPWPASRESLQFIPASSIKSIVENTCGLFVQVFDSEIHLIHQTAREYLTTPSNDGQHPWKGTISLVPANGLLCELLLKLLLMVDKSYAKSTADMEVATVLQLDDSSLPLSPYAAKYWTSHWELSTSETRATMIDMATALLCDIKPDGIQDENIAENVSIYLRAKSDPFRMASMHDLDDIFSHMLTLALEPPCTRSELIYFIKWMVTYLAKSLSYDQIQEYFRVLLTIVKSMADAQYFLDFALDLALAEGTPSTIKAIVENGSETSFWNLQFAVAFHSWSTFKNATLMKFVLESAMKGHFPAHLVTDEGLNLLDGLLTPRITEADEDVDQNVPPSRSLVIAPLKPSPKLQAQFYGYRPVGIRTVEVSLSRKLDDPEENMTYFIKSYDLELDGWFPLTTSIGPLFPSQQSAALDLAIQNGWLPIVTWLLQSEHASFSDEAMLSALSLAARQRNRELVSLIFNANPRLSRDPIEYELRSAIISGPNVDIVWLLELLPSISGETVEQLVIIALRKSRKHAAKLVLTTVSGHKSIEVFAFLTRLLRHLSIEAPGAVRTIQKLEHVQMALQIFVEVGVHVDMQNLLQTAYRAMEYPLFQLLAQHENSVQLAIRTIAVECGVSNSFKNLQNAAQMLLTIDASSEQLLVAGFENSLRQSVSTNPFMTGVSPSNGAQLVKNVILRIAISDASTALTKYLISAGFGPLSSDKTLIQRAISSKDTNMIKALLQAGIDPQLIPAGIPESLAELDRTLIQQAVSRKDVTKLKALLPAGMTQELMSKAERAPENERDSDQILMQQIMSHQFTIMMDAHLSDPRHKYDLEALQKQREKGLGSELCAASFHGRTDLVNELLKLEDIDLNAPSGLFGTALCAASYGGHLDVVMLLLNESADITASGPLGNALECAQKDEQLVRQLPYGFRATSTTTDNSMVVQLLRNHMRTPAGSAGEYTLNEQDFLNSDDDADWDFDDEDDSDDSIDVT